MPMPRLTKPMVRGASARQRDLLLIFASCVGFDDPEAVGCAHAFARRGYVSKNGTRYAAVEWAVETFVFSAWIKVV